MNDATLDLPKEDAATEDAATGTGTEAQATPSQGDARLFVSAAQVADAIRAAGCAVSAVQDGDTVRLQSASHGIGYQVLWGNAAGPDQYLDFTLSCPLHVQGGQLPDGLFNAWHRTRRFARVSSHGDFVVLEMDVVVAGVVQADYLTVAIQLWTQMMGQFFLHLRNFRADEAEAEAGRPGADPVPAGVTAQTGPSEPATEAATIS